MRDIRKTCPNSRAPAALVNCKVTLVKILAIIRPATRSGGAYPDGVGHDGEGDAAFPCRKSRRQPGSHSFRTRAALRMGAACRDPHPRQAGRLSDHASRVRRSEEHTSELQSLMRNSYAVFCLKKKI